VALAADLEAFLRSGESGKILAFVERHPNVRAEFATLSLPGGGTADPFFNVNTPEDAARADAIAAALGGP
jgi:molybdopterin-guanine dinucleotide biosynthesis protein A